jgi:hypothetical protein
MSATAGFVLVATAHAAGGASITGPAKATQGTTVNYTVKCDKGTEANLFSPLVPGGVTGLGTQTSGVWHVTYKLGDVTVGSYTQTVYCFSGTTRTGMTSMTFQVVKAPKPVPPIPGPKVIPHKNGVVIQTGFGGMAREVTSHHPAS